VKVVAGAANNQLAEPRHGEALVARGIHYAPDYAINAGGLYNVAAEASSKYDEAEVRANVTKIFDTIMEISTRAKATNEPTGKVADRIVEERLAKASR
jgi:leucine dehydrogenase